MTKIQELPIPPDANEASRAIEFIRFWLIDGSPQCSLRPTFWPDAAAWGLLLADVVRHISDAIESERSIPAEKTFERIVSAFKAEVENPTTEASGQFLTE